MRMPMTIRILVLIACIGIGAVVVRHITDALQGIPAMQQAAADQSGAR